jgi:Tfp pilus assembly protein PilF
MEDQRKQMAFEIFERAYQMQMQGELEVAVDLYKRSLSMCPTAEAHTFLGWTYRSQGKLEEAIDECKKAIALDPDFGNPYNDIGAYLIELGKVDEAVPWLERAIHSPRYASYHYPWFNLGRVYLARDLYSKARECFEHALDIDPDYTPATDAIEKIRRLIQ